MKKTAIIIAIALGFSITSLNASNDNLNQSRSEVIIKKTVNPFCMAIVKGDFKTVKRLIELGADINAKSNGMTPVMYAAKFNRLDVLKMLVAKGAKTNIKSNKGMTATKYAELSNAQEALTYLQSLKS